MAAMEAPSSKARWIHRMRQSLPWNRKPQVTIPAADISLGFSTGEAKTFRFISREPADSWIANDAYDLFDPPKRDLPLLDGSVPFIDDSYDEIAAGQPAYSQSPLKRRMRRVSVLIARPTSLFQ